MDYEILSKWLSKRIEEEDATDTKLMDLKQQVRITTAAVASAHGDAVVPALLKQSNANWALIYYLSSKHI